MSKPVDYLYTVLKIYIHIIRTALKINFYLIHARYSYKGWDLVGASDFRLTLNYLFAEDERLN